MVSLVVSPCPNDTFIVHAWRSGLVPDAPAVELDFHDVDVANGMAERGEADVLKISYAALPYVLRDYRLLPAGGALGRGCGPLVLSRAGETGRAVAGSRVAIPGDRTTAFLLYRLWAASDAGDIVVLPFEKIMPAVAAGEVDLGLVIHEARFTFSTFGLECVVDLGAWWEGETGLPIPLGAIVARRSLDPAPIVAALRASVEHAWADPLDSAGFVAEHAQEMSPDVQAAHIATYVTAFSRELGDEGYAAIEELLARASTAGLLPEVDPATLRD
ncbi:MAG: 1,4-dihydroxy-6-naphthoate synthase [Frankiales bacterium]|nr:1,4-dihydroxy-6-naphthoate synthase [Frankiales bacterium]